jgi:hypothetical protein
MRNYSFCYLDAQGRTETSTFLPFDNKAAAIEFALTGMTSHAIVEVWLDNKLVERLYRDKAPIVVPPRPGPATSAKPLPAPGVR